MSNSLLKRYQDIFNNVRFIDNAPTVDITEEQAIDKLHETGWLPRHDKEMTDRPTGEWEKSFEHRGRLYHKCSNCHLTSAVPTAMSEPMYKYCPNCGAYMKGENE